MSSDTIALLTDRAEVERLVHRLGAALDEGRFDDLHSVFTADATAVTPGGRADGRDALVAQASRNHTADARIQHTVSGVLVDVDGEEAAVRANLVVTFARRTEPGPFAVPYFTLGEVYRFTARRTPDGWRLASVATEPMWATGSRDGSRTA